MIVCTFFVLAIVLDDWCILYRFILEDERRFSIVFLGFRLSCCCTSCDIFCALLLWSEWFSCWFRGNSSCCCWVNRFLGFLRLLRCWHNLNRRSIDGTVIVSDWGNRSISICLWLLLVLLLWLLFRCCCCSGFLSFHLRLRYWLLWANRRCVCSCHDPLFCRIDCSSNQGSIMLLIIGTDDWSTAIIVSRIRCISCVVIVVVVVVAWVVVHVSLGDLWRWYVDNDSIAVAVAIAAEV